jgi:hypothetical protein
MSVYEVGIANKESKTFKRMICSAGLNFTERHRDTDTIRDLS